MRTFLLIFSLFLSSVIYCQYYFFGDFQSRYLIEKKQYLSDNHHSFSKPYLVNKSSFELRQTGIWKHAYSLDSSNFKFLPVVGANLKFDAESNYISRSSQVGFQLNSSLNEIFYTQFKVGFQSGNLSDYESFSTFKRPYAPGIGYLNDTLKKSYSKLLLEGLISWHLSNYFVLSGGVGKNFFGDGYRSLLLSDYAPSHPFLKLESTFWKVKYVNLWSLHDDLHTQLYSRNKWSSSHMLSFNAFNWLNLSVFESIVWQGQDTLSKRQFDINYINPFVFYRPIEYGIGSADNSFLGGGLKIKFLKNYVFYSNFIIDEFLLSQIKSKAGWWGNKYGYQFGLKAFDIFKIKGLYGFLEWNAVRPYTYSHMTSMQNYGHQNHSLAHPLESNFYEALVILAYQNGNFDFLIQYHYQIFGADKNFENYGGNMFSSYNNRFNNNLEYGHFISQGEKNIQQIFSTRLSIMLFPLTNTKLFSQLDIRFSKGIKTSLVNFGISSNLWQSYFDY
tara:strand:- start:47867 stop:49372 length:1506 start_codon:yes stop_codon:yes gene_type:complete